MQQQGRIRRENQDSRGSRRDVSRPGYCFSVLFFNTILVTNDILDISSPSQTKSSSCQWSVQLVLPTIPRLHETLTFTVTGDHDRSSVIPCACVFFHEPPPPQWTAQRPLGMLFYVSLFILFTNYVYRYKNTVYYNTAVQEHVSTKIRQYSGVCGLTKSITIMLMNTTTTQR